MFTFNIIVNRSNFAFNFYVTSTCNFWDKIAQSFFSSVYIYRTSTYNTLYAFCIPRYFRKRRNYCFMMHNISCNLLKFIHILSPVEHKANIFKDASVFLHPQCKSMVVWRMNQCSNVVWTSVLFTIFYFVFFQRYKCMQLCNDMRVSKWWQNFHFRVKYPFNMHMRVLQFHAWLKEIVGLIFGVSDGISF